jgi:hypothetical protein
MAKYTEAEIIQILRDADIPEKDIPMMLAIAMAESRGDSDAVGDEKLANDKWDASIGLFQVRSLRNPEKYNKADKLRIKDKLFDPIYNAKVAYEISKKGKDYTDWSTYNDDTYRKFLPNRSSRSQIRIAGGGRGKGKPITMAEENITPDNQYQGLPGYIDPKQTKIESKLAKEKKKLKELKADFNKVKSTVTEAEVKKQEKKVADAQTEYKNFISAEKTAQSAESIKSEKERSIAKADKRIADLQKEITRTETTGFQKQVPGQKGPAAEATKDYLKSLNDKLAAAKAEAQKLGVSTSVVQAPEADYSKGVLGTGGGLPFPTNPQQRVNFDGSPKPVVPVGTGETVYLGDVDSLKAVSYPSLGQTVDTRSMFTSGGTNVPQDRTALEGMWYNNSPKAVSIIKRFKDLYASKGKVATLSDWKDALNYTAAVNTDNPSQTLWETAESMIANGAGSTGTGPSAKELKNKKEAVKLLATELGVELTDGQINSLGYDYANGNIDATTVKSRIASTGNINFATGEAAKTIDSLKATAASYGVSYDPSWYTQSAKDILTGKVDNDTLAQQLKELAKSRYPSLTKQIDAGYTVKQIASPYLQSMANILEINPNDITMEDPTIKQAFTSLNADGQPSTKALWQFEQDLKQDSRWKFTKNAQTDLMGTAHKVLQDFGLVY